MHRKYCDITAETCAPANPSLPPRLLQTLRRRAQRDWLYFANTQEGGRICMEQCRPVRGEREVSGLQRGLNTWSIALHGLNLYAPSAFPPTTLHFSFQLCPAFILSSVFIVLKELQSGDQKLYPEILAPCVLH